MARPSWQMLEALVRGLKHSGGGRFSLVYDPEHDPGREWAVGAEFGEEAPNSPMAGGASYQIAGSASAALDGLLEEAGWYRLLELGDAAIKAGDDLGTLPQWLFQRFRGPLQRRVSWNELDQDERLYWAHEAAAVFRAVQRGGFKDPNRQMATERPLSEVEVAAGAVERGPSRPLPSPSVPPRDSVLGRSQMEVDRDMTEQLGDGKDYC